MKKYTKPTVNVVSLKSSEDIATSFDSIKDGMIRNYLNNSTTYTVSQYAVNTSNFKESTPVES